jgi:hypothetical protein
MEIELEKSRYAGTRHFSVSLEVAAIGVTLPVKDLHPPSLPNCDLPYLPESVLERRVMLSTRYSGAGGCVNFRSVMSEELMME